MLNKVIMMGRLVATPELKTTQNGIKVATFRLAIDRNYVDKESKDRQTDFISCVAWRGIGEFISKYFTKGRMIAIEGSLRSRNYEDKNGQNRTAYEVEIDDAYFADSRPSTADNQPPFSNPDSFFAPKLDVSEEQVSNTSKSGARKQTSSQLWDEFANGYKQGGQSVLSKRNTIYKF